MIAPVVVVAMKTIARELDRLWGGTSDLQPRNWTEQEKIELKLTDSALGKAWVWLKHFGG